MVRVSIIVPVYNVDKYIGTCVQSLVDQTFDEIEIILVNDGSTDNSQEIIQDYKNRFPEKITIIDQKNKGASEARNKGISVSKGDYVTFVDGDDSLHIDMIQELYDVAIQNDADIVLCNGKVIDEISGKLRDVWNSGKMKNKVENLFTNKQLLNTVLPAPWGKLYKKELFINNGIKYPLGLRNQDLGTTPRILINCERICKVDKSLYNYLYRSESAMRSYDEKILDVIKNLKIVKDYYCLKEVDREFYLELEYLFIEHLLFRGIYRIKNIDNIGTIKQYANEVYTFLEKEYPDWNKNKYIKELPIKKRIYLMLIKRGLINCVMWLFYIKKKVKAL